MRSPKNALLFALRSVILVAVVLSSIVAYILINPILLDSTLSYTWPVWRRALSLQDKNAVWEEIAFAKFYKRIYTVRESVLGLDFSEEAFSTVPDVLDSPMIPRQYPLRVWVDGDAVLWEEARIAAHTWEYEILKDRGGSVKGDFFLFTENKEEADIIVSVSGFYFVRGTICILPEGVFVGKFCAPRFPDSPMVILLTPLIRGDQVEIATTILHELGHAGFALPHNPDPLSIMNSDASGNLRVTADDVTAAKAFLERH